MSLALASAMLSIIVLSALGIDAAGCPDLAPPKTKFSCAEQKEYGKCDEGFLKGYCLLTCGRCNECTDTPPDSKYTCAQQKEFGKCGTAFLDDGYFCRETCGACGTANGTEPGITNTKTVAPAPGGGQTELSTSTPSDGSGSPAALAGATGDKTSTSTKVTKEGSSSTSGAGSMKKVAGTTVEAKSSARSGSTRK